MVVFHHDQSYNFIKLWLYASWRIMVLLQLAFKSHTLFVLPKSLAIICRRQGMLVVRSKTIPMTWFNHHRFRGFDLTWKLVVCGNFVQATRNFMESSAGRWPRLYRETPRFRYRLLDFLCNVTNRKEWYGKSSPVVQGIRSDSKPTEEFFFIYTSCGESAYPFAACRISSTNNQCNQRKKKDKVS